MSKVIEVICPKCKQTRWMFLKNFKRGGETGLCLSCHNLNQKGKPKVGRPIGGKEKTMHEGYVLIRQPNHPRAVYNAFVKRAILVMEELLGRPIRVEEIVHHKNRIRSDDNPANLQLFANEHNHLCYHTKQGDYFRKP